MLKGEYQINLKSIQNCCSTNNDKIHLNYYINRKSDNSTEIKGNITTTIIIDETLSVRYIIYV